VNDRQNPFGQRHCRERNDRLAKPLRSESAHDIVPEVVPPLRIPKEIRLRVGGQKSLHNYRGTDDHNRETDQPESGTTHQNRDCGRK
jgi:hypothetical protein